MASKITLVLLIWLALSLLVGPVVGSFIRAGETEEQ